MRSWLNGEAVTVDTQYSAGDLSYYSDESKMTYRNMLSPNGKFNFFQHYCMFFSVPCTPAELKATAKEHQEHKYCTRKQHNKKAGLGE